MRLIAIDPGSERSAWLIYDTETHLPERWPTLENELEGGITENEELSEILRCGMGPAPKHLAIEMVASYGMPVGKSIFETVLWTGRFIQAWERPYTKLYRKDIKMALCGRASAKDSNIRQALIDRFPATGGGKVPQIGTKKKPGPLYGIKRDLWSALAIAVTWKLQQEASNG